MYQMILVPLDGSARAEGILPYAKALAQKFSATILLLQVVEPEIEFFGSQSRHQDDALEQFRKDTAQAENYLQSLKEQLRAEGYQVQHQAAHGDVVKTILNTSRGTRVDLVAMASHGRTGLAQVYYGSVTAGILNQIDRPLLVVRADSAAFPKPHDGSAYQKILLPLDGSERAERIFPYVEEIARAFNAHLFLLQVVEPAFVYASPSSHYANSGLFLAEGNLLRKNARDYLERQTAAFQNKGLQVDYRVTIGPVARAILDHAAEIKVDLIAMASHGHTGLAQVFYGSVAAGVLHQVDRPLLLIRTQEK